MAFFNNKITGELDLSENINLKYIGSNSFKNNNIESITIPHNIEKIEESAFIKNNESNSNLLSIVNLSEKELDWSSIIFGNIDKTFDYGFINEVEIKEP